MRLLAAMIMTVALLFTSAPAQKRDDRAEVALRAAIDKETVDGDLKGAIDEYIKLAQSSNREVAASALLRAGQCYEKLGQADARKTYEQLLRQYADQSEVAAEARTRLAALERAGGLSHPSGITLRKVWESRGEFDGSPSPDGRYFSFHDWETGDLAVRDLATGQNRRLTNKGASKDSSEFAEGSVISGDGRQIAYAWHNKEKYYELRVCGIDGSNPRTVYRDKEFGYSLEPWQWTADGKQILVALWRREPDETRIALIPVAGGPARILPTRAKSPWDPSLSPDGRFLVYDSPTREGVGVSGFEIFLLFLEGGQEVPLVRLPYGGWYPFWMPDGKKVLFISDRTGAKGFWAIDVVEGKPQGIPRLLKDGVGRGVRPNGFTRQGAFYYTTNNSIADVYVTELDPAEGKMLRQPTPAASRLFGSNSAPSWSPDGRRLAYYRRDDQVESPTLVILSVETGEARDVPVKLEPYLVHVHWFPDGKSILVGAWESSRHDSIGFYRVDLQTGDYRLVLSSPGPVIGHAELSPDGKTLFFFSLGEPKLRGGVISRDLESGKEQELAKVPYLAGSGWARLASSPDGKQLAFRSPIDERQWTALWLLPATGGELRELARFPQSETEDFRELAWTPDGRNVLIARRTGKDEMPELWRIPIAGGEPQRTGLSVEGIGIVAPHPDGRRIAFDTGNRGGSPNELWVLENFLPPLKSAR